MREDAEHILRGVEVQELQSVLDGVHSGLVELLDHNWALQYLIGVEVSNVDRRRNLLSTLVVLHLTLALVDWGGV